MENKLCPVCNFSVIEGYNYCPNCGTKLRDIVFAISVGKQISVYLLSVFLPPLGLFPGIKYLMQKEEKAKIVGFVAITLTIISSIITIWLTLGVVHSMQKGIGGSVDQSQLQDLGL